MSGIDAFGYLSHDEGNPDLERPNEVVGDLFELVNSTGRTVD
ncbi:hypothetical protein [Capsulimonas corticalis]|nr:hypothetical protein [Capsulimonas corticalis]